MTTEELMDKVFDIEIRYQICEPHLDKVKELNQKISNLISQPISVENSVEARDNRIEQIKSQIKHFTTRIEEYNTEFETIITDYSKIMGQHNSPIKNDFDTMEFDLTNKTIKIIYNRMDGKNPSKEIKKLVL